LIEIVREYTISYNPRYHMPRLYMTQSECQFGFI